jgi:hypothetical protein
MTIDDLGVADGVEHAAATRPAPARRAAPARSCSAPGATASLRRLTFAVTGAADPVPPPVLSAALERRARTARTAGCSEAAAVFDAARRYLSRAFEDPSAPGSPVCSADRQLLLAAAVRQVHRAHTLVRDTRISLLRPPADPPDPGLIATPAALIDDLRALYDWSGLEAHAIADAARRAGLRTNAARLLATLDSRRFPSPTTVEAITRGCGLSDRQCCAWLTARHRAARTLPALAGQAGVDPESAETPAQLTALLVELKERRGPGFRQILQAAQLAGCAVSWSRLWRVEAHYEFPTPRALEAYLIGCGLDPDEREPWLATRKRLAARRRRAERSILHEAPPDQRRPDAPPDPSGAHTWAQFSATLRALVEWSGRDLAEIAQAAMAGGVPVTTDALHYTLAYRALPDPSTLNALTIGCGLSRQEQFGWRMVRARLATLPPRSQRLPAFRALNSSTVSRRAAPPASALAL